MAIKKYFERMEYIIFKIRSKSTGSPIDFATKIGYSKSMLYEDIEDLKSMGAEIVYDRSINSFIFLNDFNIILKTDDLNKILGGKSFNPVLLDSFSLNLYFKS